MCEEKMECLLDNLANVASMIKKFVELRHLVHCGLKEKMHHLRMKLDNLEAPTCMRDKQLRCKILHNIIVREEMQTKVLELCKRLLPLENMLFDVTENLSIGIDGLKVMEMRLGDLFEIGRDVLPMYNL
jgi:predicted HAD superfamily phosphohydrolase